MSESYYAVAIGIETHSTQLRRRFNLDEAVVIGVVVNGLTRKLPAGEQAPKLQNGILVLRAEMPRIVIVGARSIEGQVVPVAVDAGRSRHLSQLCGGPSRAAGTGGPTAGFRIPIGRGDRARIAPDQTTNLPRVGNIGDPLEKTEVID